MHTGKELEAHWVQKGRLSCDSDAPQVWECSARLDKGRINLQQLHNIAICNLYLKH